MPPGAEITSSNVLAPPRYLIDFINTSGSKDNIDNVTDSIIKNIQSEGEYIGTVVENKRITEESHFQDVRHIEIETNAMYILFNTRYKAGDVLIVRPRNISDKVQQAIEYFSWADIADKPINISANPYYTG